MLDKINQMPYSKHLEYQKVIIVVSITFVLE